MRHIAAEFYLAVIASLPVAAMAQTRSGADTQKLDSLGERIHSFAAQEVEQYEISIEGTDAQLERLPQSVLRWSNLTRKFAYGDTYIWTHQGCAQVIVSIYAIGPPENMMSLEFQSLCEHSLIARRGERVIWNPQRSGVEFIVLDDVSAPARSPALRLSQMNAIARSFHAEYATHLTPGEFNELRLLAKPLFRYQSNNSNVIDGAIYGFVESTDPEALLVVEARRQGDSQSWVYSPARSRHDHLRFSRKGQLVWDREQLAPPWENMRKLDGPYYNERWQVIADSEDESELEALFADPAPTD